MNIHHPHLEDAILELELCVQALRSLDQEHESTSSPLLSTIEHHVRRLRDAHEAACQVTP
jgi:hypothetical protein